MEPSGNSSDAEEQLRFLDEYVAALGNDYDPRMPILWYDKQGFEICSELKGEFADVAISHRGLAFKRGADWLCGSLIYTSGLLDSTRWEGLIARVQQIVSERANAPVLIEWHRDIESERHGQMPLATFQVGEGKAMRVY